MFSALSTSISMNNWIGNEQVGDVLCLAGSVKGVIVEKIREGMIITNTRMGKLK